ncbi:MAG: hypothetical protein WCK11_02735 [Candidatus Falkowbacteria bacterium]
MHYQLDSTDIPLLDYTNIFVANLVFMRRNIDQEIATFDLVVRELPDNWGFYIFDGLERMIDLLLKFHYDQNAIATLKKMGLIDSKKSEQFYKNFRFSGDVWAMKDGTVFFPGEPIVRITAPIAEANLLTAFLLNAFGFPVRILSKTLRVKIACAHTLFFGSSLARLPGFEQGYYSLRAAYLLGSKVATPVFYRKHEEIAAPDKITATIQHAFIKSFDTEQIAYRYLLDELFDKADFFMVMIDTYDMKQGLNTLIHEIEQTPHFNSKKIMITIDSGDIKAQAHYVRKVLDKNNLKDVRIQAMSNLTEYSIDQMVKSKTPIDCYISGTSLVNIIDNPKFEAVYKLAEIEHQDGTIEPKAKLTKGKESYPGKKQIFRIYKNGKIVKDIIGLEDEHLGKPLLHKVISQGKLTNKLSDINETKKFIETEIDALPSTYKTIYCTKKYPISTSKKLTELTNQVKKKHLH